MRFLPLLQSQAMSNTTTTLTAPPTPHAARLAERGIIIRESASEESTPKKVPVGKGEKKLKKAPVSPSRDSTPSPIRKARREAE